MRGAQYAGRYADEPRQRHRHQRDFERDDSAAHHRLANWLGVPEGMAEVAPGDVGHPTQVLLRQRLIQSKAGPRGRQLGLRETILALAFAGDLRQRITRQDAHGDEDQHRNAEQRRHGSDHPPQQVALHASLVWLRVEPGDVHAAPFTLDTLFQRKAANVRAPHQQVIGKADE